jgi:hypothetical protein
MASPLGNAIGWIGDRAEDVVDNFKKKSLTDKAWAIASKAPGIGPVVPPVKWAITDQKEENNWTPPAGYGVLLPKDQRERNMRAWRAEQRAKEEATQNRNRQQNINAREQLDSILQSNAGITSEMISKRARRAVMPVFRPQIRNTKRSIREAEADRLQVLQEGKQAAGDVMGYYDEARGMTRGYAKQDRRGTKRMAKKLRADGDVSAREQIALKAAKGSSRANRNFYKRVGASLAGEGAVAAAATRRNYQDVSEQYRDIANEYKGELADLRSARAQAVQEGKSQIKSKIKNTAATAYQDIYLQGIESGMSKAQAQKLALAQAKTQGKAVAGETASLIKKNKKIENLLVGSSQSGSGLSSEDRWDRKMDKQKLANDQLGGMMSYLGDAQKAYKDAVETGNDAVAQQNALIIDAIRNKLNQVYGLNPQ